VDHVVNRVTVVQKVKLDDLVFLVHLVRMHHYNSLHRVNQAIKDIKVMLGKSSCSNI
jgi:fumarate reductase subunit D